MRRTLIYSLTLLIQAAAAVAQTAPPDSQMTQTMLTEIRQLRHDLQAAAAVIQRVQIVMYRLQTETTVLDRTTQRLDQARSSCNQAQTQRRMVTAQMEQAEARKHNSQSQADQRAEEEVLFRLKSSIEMLAGEEQQCQVEQVDAETRFRTEDARVKDLQDQLDKLDKVLAGYGSK
jgi:chromosome segregation ATPase